MTTIAQQEASRLNGARSRGPATPEGLARSSMNAVGLGIRARSVLLTDEEEVTFNLLLAAKMEALCPANAAEAETVHHLAFLDLRFSRLIAAEKMQLQRAVEDELAATDVHRRLEQLDLALLGLRALVETVERSRPTSSGALTSFVPALRQVVNVVRDIENKSSALVTGLPQLMHAAHCIEDWDGPAWPADLFRSLSSLAGVVIDHLALRRERDAAEVAELRHELSARAVPPHDATTKRLASYRRQLEREQLHHLHVLEQLRRLRPPAPATSGSFVRSRINLLRRAPPSA